MKIVSIFDERLFAFHFKDEADNEFDRLIDLWSDSLYLYEFAKNNLQNADIKKYVEERLEDFEQMEDLIDKIATNADLNFDVLFVPLNDYEYIPKILSLRKGKTKHKHRRNDLRLYAIRIDDDCFVITGGTIKLSQAMQENPLSNLELQKLKKCKLYLEGNGITDIDTFFELILE